MKKTSNHLLAATLVLSCVLFSSCNRYYYQPNSVNAPMLSDQGDVHVVMNGSFGNETVNSSNSTNHVINIQAAGSPVKHLGIIGGFTNYDFTVTSNPDRAAGRVNARANLAEIGVGTYMEFLERTDGRKLLADVYGGTGIATIKSDVNMDAMRYFLQPGFTFRSHYFDASFNMRFSGVKYSNFDANGYNDDYLRSKNLISENGRIDDRLHVFAEPSVTLRGGYKFIKAQLQWTLASSLSSVPWNYNGSLFTVGFAFDMEGLKK